jgi:hypothetical protein
VHWKCCLQPESAQKSIQSELSVNRHLEYFWNGISRIYNNHRLLLWYKVLHVGLFQNRCHFSKLRATMSVWTYKTLVLSCRKKNKDRTLTPFAIYEKSNANERKIRCCCFASVTSVKTNLILYLFLIFPRWLHAIVITLFHSSSMLLNWSNVFEATGKIDINTMCWIFHKFWVCFKGLSRVVLLEEYCVVLSL